ncbi:MAG TPA: hypothetical protein VEW25_02825 [Allosphingosinicella sp.]|nr:hypothetical protein [Allosphingosinicella sp.]
MNPDAIIFAILTTGAVLIVTQLARLLRAWMHHRTLREAISRDNSSVPELLGALDQEQPTPGGGDERTGFVLIALGVALFLYSLVSVELRDIGPVAGAALFPILVGAALLVRFYIARKRARQG